MKKILVAGVGLLALATAMPALAADLPARPAPVYKAPPPAVIYYSWTGCYIGGHGGGVWISKDARAGSDLVPVGFPVAPAGTDFGSHDASSWIVGVQGGCNYQFAGGFVIGIQGDYAWTDAEGTHADPFYIGETQRSKTKSLASVTGRVGYAWDRFLGYVKGGWAWERDDYDSYVTATSFVLATGSETRGGWTVGVGGEYAFTDWLTGFVEYNYYDFGSKWVAFTDFNGVSIGSIDINETKSVVKAGLNFKFGGGGPVAARY